MEEYIRDNVVPEILKHYNNCISDYKLMKCEIRPLEIMVNNWSSFLYTLDLSVVVAIEDSSLDQDYSLFVKCIMDNCSTRSYETSKIQFVNEVHIYKTVQPIFKKLLCQKNVKLFPEVPYAVMKDIKSEQHIEQTDGIVVLENLVKQGYKLAPQKFLDMDHCVLALEQLGRWHALSMVVKELNPEQFHGEIVSNIQQHIWNKQNEVRNQFSYYPFIERLYEKAKYAEHPKTFSAVKIIKEKCENFTQYMIDIEESSKQSKLSVLCHGDYCRNNILFKYTETGVPMAAIPIDYQNVFHGSPAIDLSAFIYLSTKYEIHENSVMELIEKYHASLVTTMKEILIKETKKTSEDISAILPSLDCILKDYKQHGIFGLMHATYFIPILCANQEEIHNIISASGDLKSKEYYDCAMNIGGEAAINMVINTFDIALKLNQVTIE